MFDQKNLISIIIRAYNSGKFIEKAINSALNQKLDKKFFEILIIDDGSTDDTIDKLRAYREKIKVVKQKHLGPTVALNRGLEEAMGEYIIILDSDDIFSPDILEKMLNVFKKDKTVGYVYSDYTELFENGKIKKVSLAKNIFDCLAGGIMFKKDLLKLIGGYDEKLIFPEYDVIIKIIKSAKGFYIPQPLFTYCRRSGSLTSSKKLVREGKKQLFSRYKKKIDIRNY